MPRVLFGSNLLAIPLRLFRPAQGKSIVGNDLLADRPERQPSKFQMSPRKRQSNDGDRQASSRDEVGKSQPPASEQKPDKIADDAEGARPNRRPARIFLSVDCGM